MYKKWCVQLCKFGFGERGCVLQQDSYSNDNGKRKLHPKKKDNNKKLLTETKFLYF